MASFAKLKHPMKNGKHFHCRECRKYDPRPGRTIGQTGDIEAIYHKSVALSSNWKEVSKRY